MTMYGYEWLCMADMEIILALLETYNAGAIPTAKSWTLINIIVKELHDLSQVAVLQSVSTAC